MDEVSIDDSTYGMKDAANFADISEKPSSTLEKIALGAGCAVLVPFAVATLIACIPAAIVYNAWCKGRTAYYKLRGISYPQNSSTFD